MTHVLPLPHGPSRLVLCLALLAPAAASAWSPKTHEEVATQAACLMPRELKHLLAKHRTRLMAGAQASLTDIGPKGEGASCSLDKAVLTQSQRILDLLGARASTSTVAYEMGVLSHLVALAQDPAHETTDARDADWTSSFARFVEARTPRFRIVFDGYLAETLERDDVASFARALCSRSERYYPLLVSSYVTDDGRVADDSRFDERHPVFGIGELAYAHAIGDTAKIWLYLWIRAGGDTTGIPHPSALRPAEAPVGGAQ